MRKPATVEELFTKCIVETPLGDLLREKLSAKQFAESMESLKKLWKKNHEGSTE